MGHCSALAVSLELGDVSLVSVPPESLQPAPDRGSRGQLIAQLQELLHHWALWSAVKSRWVIVGKWGLRPPSPLIFSFSPVPEAWGQTPPKDIPPLRAQPPPANDPGLASCSLGLTPFPCRMELLPHNCCLWGTYCVPVIMPGGRAERLMLGLWSPTSLAGLES